MTLIAQIEMLRVQLNDAIKNNNYSLTGNDVLTISQNLDKLIVTYHKQELGLAMS